MALVPVWRSGLAGIPAGAIPIPVGNPNTANERALAPVARNYAGDTGTFIGVSAARLVFAPDGTVLDAGEPTGEVLTPSQVVLLFHNPSIADPRALLASYPDVAALANAEATQNAAALAAAQQHDVTTAAVQALVQTGQASGTTIAAATTGTPVTGAGVVETQTPGTQGAGTITASIHPSDQMLDANPTMAIPAISTPFVPFGSDTSGASGAGAVPAPPSAGRTSMGILIAAASVAALLAVGARGGRPRR